MSNNLRHDTECQNCGYTVDVAYCSKCGQKNTETRQSFGHLITHFAEDLTHYDGAFWKTIKYLIFRPGKLTVEYLQGHRMRYVPPVKLYIFISFVTFFILAVDIKKDLRENDGETPAAAQTDDELNLGGVKVNGLDAEENEPGFKSVQQLDSIQNTLPEEDKMGWLEYRIQKKQIEVGNKGFDRGEVLEAFLHNMPKALFLYMPVFAFWLWLFHGKRKWYFFDHGIYTLHYFAFLLLLYTFFKIITVTAKFADIPYLSSALVGICGFTAFSYSVFYFFRSHRIIYGEKRWISRLKGMVLFWINFICMSTLFVLTLIYTLLNIH